MSEQYVCDNPDCRVVNKGQLADAWYTLTQEQGPYRWHFCSAECLRRGPFPVPDWGGGIIAVQVPFNVKGGKR